jgi:uncharacterized protein (TIGR02145 family)
MKSHAMILCCALALGACSSSATDGNGAESGSSSAGGSCEGALSSVSLSSGEALSGIATSSVAASSNAAASSVALSSLATLSSAAPSSVSTSSLAASSSTALSSQVAGRVCTYTVTDSPLAGAGTLACDEKTYKTVTMGTQVWMAENLDFGTQVAGSAEQTDATNASAQKYCYSDQADNGTTYGGLYQWPTVMALPYFCSVLTTTTTSALPCRINSPSHRGICPEGWHVPMQAEWATLDSWTDTNNAGATDDEGTSLKSTNLWSSDPGTNDYGWGGLPAGQRNAGIFYSQGNAGYWWSASESGVAYAWFRSVVIGTAYLREYIYSMSYYGYSLRCLKDSV